VSPDADTTLLFTRPYIAPGEAAVELPAGQIVEFLVGFANNGDNEFTVDSLDASFRYPMDFSYHIQNFSAIAYQKQVSFGSSSSLESLSIYHYYTGHDRALSHLSHLT